MRPRDIDTNGASLHCEPVGDCESGRSLILPAGRRVDASGRRYTAEDLADNAVGVLDGHELDRADPVGIALAGERQRIPTWPRVWKRRGSDKPQQTAAATSHVPLA